MRYILLLFVLGCANRDTYDYLNKKSEPVDLSQPATPPSTPSNASENEPQPAHYIYITPTTINNYNHYNINFYVGRKGNYGIECNGYDSYIQVPDEFFSSPHGSIEVMVYSYGRGRGPVSGLIHKGVEMDYSDESISLHVSNDDDDDEEEDDDDDEVKNRRLHLKVKRWYHITMTWDDKKIYMYRDGVLIYAVVRVVKLNPAPLLLCAQTKEKFSDRWGRMSFYGKMERIMVYNRCLNKDEVGALYQDSK